MRQPLKQLDILLNKSTKKLAYQLAEAIYSIALGNGNQLRETEIHFAETMRKASAMADILGRKKAAQEVQGIKQGNKVIFQKAPQNEDQFSIEFDFDVPFDDALDNLGETNKLVKELGFIPEVKSAYSPHRYYQRERANLKLAPLFKDSPESKINEIILDDLAFGRDKEATLKKIAQYTQGRADTIYRKKIAEAYTGGRLRSLQNEEVKDLVKAVIFNATDDRDVRPDHWALHETVLAPNSSWLKFIAPPIYYNCRCSFQLVGEDHLKSFKNGAHWRKGQLVESKLTMEKLPKQRFDTRPDLQIYG